MAEWKDSRMLVAGVLILGVCAGGARPAIASYMTGNYILQACASKGTYDYSFCQGYVAGVADLMLSDPKYKNTLCMPDSVTIGQIVDISIITLKQFPNVRHENADGIIGAALLHAFPCRK
jgi:hypothetical protein